jgi:hypothetical protein
MTIRVGAWWQSGRARSDRSFPFCGQLTPDGHTAISGVQLHLTSLPDGRLGRSAYAFVDWLERAGQSWWQTLPLGPPDGRGSPYKARSAFAAWRGCWPTRPPR